MIAPVDERRHGMGVSRYVRSTAANQVQQGVRYSHGSRGGRAGKRRSRYSRKPATPYAQTPVILHMIVAGVANLIAMIAACTMHLILADKLESTRRYQTREACLRLHHVALDALRTSFPC